MQFTAWSFTWASCCRLLDGPGATKYVRQVRQPIELLRQSVTEVLTRDIDTFCTGSGRTHQIRPLKTISKVRLKSKKHSNEAFSDKTFSLTVTILEREDQIGNGIVNSPPLGMIFEKRHALEVRRINDNRLRPIHLPLHFSRQRGGAIALASKVNESGKQLTPILAHGTGIPLLAGSDRQLSPRQTHRNSTGSRCGFEVVILVANHDTMIG